MVVPGSGQRLLGVEDELVEVRKERYFNWWGVGSFDGATEAMGRQQEGPGKAQLDPVT